MGAPQRPFFAPTAALSTISDELAVSLSVFARFGFSEWDLREHSFEWVERAAAELGRSRRIDLANQLSLMALASVLPHGGEEAHDQYQQTLEELNSSPEEPTYLTDPNAKPDLEAIRAAGFPIQRVPKEGTTQP